eukprot:353453-Chlamydomonas_euryale.AAC.4
MAPFVTELSPTSTTKNSVMSCDDTAPFTLTLIGPATAPQTAVDTATAKLHTCMQACRGVIGVTMRVRERAHVFVQITPMSQHAGSWVSQNGPNKDAA